MSTPKIDVVMPVYNAEAYVGDAVRSILHQRFSNLRLICVDDGSTDRSREILRKLAANDERLEIIRQENRGVVRALNRGLSVCTAPLIARMDADDISMPERFARQVEFLEQNPNVLAVGTSILEMDSEGAPLGVQHFASDHEEIDSGMLRIRTGMAHPTVMMRRQAVQALSGYRVEFEWVEDLDLWLRMAEQGRLANLPEVLLCYRQHASSISWSVGRVRRERTIALMEEAYARRGLTLPVGLIERCRANRSPCGPGKWARKASRHGQWGVACKHLRRQWKQAPWSLLTWRTTLEVAARSTLGRLLKSESKLPKVPCYHEAA
jgi:glycosyltransferase involved in cell wall biosynthesis